MAPGREILRRWVFKAAFTRWVTSVTKSIGLGSYLEGSLLRLVRYLMRSELSTCGGGFVGRELNNLHIVSLILFRHIWGGPFSDASDAFYRVDSQVGYQVLEGNC